MSSYARRIVHPLQVSRAQRQQQRHGGQHTEGEHTRPLDAPLGLFRFSGLRRRIGGFGWLVGHCRSTPRPPCLRPPPRRVGIGVGRHGGLVLCGLILTVFAHGTNSTLDTLASSPTFCTEMRIRQARGCLFGRAGVGRLDRHRDQHLSPVVGFGLQSRLGDGADRLRLCLLDDLDERLRTLLEVVVEGSRRGVQDALHVRVGLLPVDRGQVQRALSADLEEELALLIGLMRLVGAEPQPARQPGQHHHQRPARRSSPAADATSAASRARLLSASSSAVSSPWSALSSSPSVASSVSGRVGDLGTARLRLGCARRLLGGRRLAQFPVGGSSIVCHVRSSVALRARLDCVYTRPSGPTYVPVAGSYSAAAIGGGAGPGGGAACAGGDPAATAESAGRTASRSGRPSSCSRR